MKQGHQPASIKAIFDWLDELGNGLIGETELVPLLEHFQLKFSELDKDGDGFLNIAEFLPIGKLILQHGITFEELEQFWKTPPEGHSFTEKDIQRLKTIFEVQE
jgi:Ca2+-binding EF-hand superfamily protein